MKRFFSVIIILVLTTLLAACKTSNHSSLTSSAGKPAETTKSPNGFDPVNKLEGNLAIRGYDVVAYFQESKAVEGSAEFSHDYLGAKWYFSKAEYRDLFAREPQKYAPQYGGYCSWQHSNRHPKNLLHNTVVTAPGQSATVTPPTAIRKPGRLLITNSI